MAVVLALVAAASWGSSDFLAGLASRRASALNVVVGAHLVGLLSLAVLAPALSGSLRGEDLLWGAAGGVGGGIGTALLYRGLAVGRMAVVAPITGAGAAAIPAIAGILAGDSLSPTGLLGIALALLAIALVAMAPAPPGVSAPADEGVTDLLIRAPAALPRILEPDVARGRLTPRALLREPGLVHAVVAGIGFGAFYVCLGRASADSGLWPLLAARVGSVLLLGGAAFAIKRRVLPPPDVRRGAFFVGVLDVTAVALFLVASRHGMLSVVSVLTSLYPAVTVLLALIVAGETCSKPQVAGMVLAGLAIGLIATA